VSSIIVSFGLVLREREREQGMWGSDRRIQLEDLRDVGLDRGRTGKRRIR
jgi:hypothetical protein